LHLKIAELVYYGKYYFPPEVKDSPTSHSLKEINTGKFTDSLIDMFFSYSMFEGLLISIPSVSKTISIKGNVLHYTYLIKLTECVTW
jgi:hypothetical protein